MSFDELLGDSSMTIASSVLCGKRCANTERKKGQIDLWGGTINKFTSPRTSSPRSVIVGVESTLK